MDEVQYRVYYGSSKKEKQRFDLENAALPSLLS
jgi:hypothetical protein